MYERKMHKTMEIRIRRKSLPQWLIWWIIVMPLLNYVLFDLMKLPRFLLYSCDVCWMGLFILSMLNSEKQETPEAQVFKVWTWIFLLYTAVVYVLKYQSIFYYLWGLRNNFRYYAFFVAIIYYMNQDHVTDFLKIIDAAFWINFGLSLLQFYVFGLRGDHMVGIFGTQNGANAYTIILMTIVLSKSIIMYLQHEEKSSIFALKTVAALIIAAYAELKVFFLIMIAIFGMAYMIVGRSGRKFWLVVGGTAAIIVGTTLLGQIFASGGNEWFNIENLLDLALNDRGYTSRGDLNRLASVSQINNWFFSDWYEKLFGMGLGNCDTSGVALFSSPFSARYSWMHHTWFSIAMLYLETGYLGLIHYLGFFVLCFIMARKEKQRENGNELYCGMAMIMAVVCWILTAYNSSLRTEAGYMVYFVLALPFVHSNEGKNIESADLEKEALP